MGKFLLILGRGVGQVMFQNNALSGGLMLVGVLLNSWQMALLAVAGNIVGTLTAYLFGYSREDIENGLYGFNGTLVGIAIGVFMSITLPSLLLLIVVSCLSTWIYGSFYSVCMDITVCLFLLVSFFTIEIRKYCGNASIRFLTVV